MARNMLVDAEGQTRAQTLKITNTKGIIKVDRVPMTNEGTGVPQELMIELALVQEPLEVEVVKGFLPKVRLMTLMIPEMKMNLKMKMKTLYLMVTPVMRVLILALTMMTMVGVSRPRLNPLIGAAEGVGAIFD